VALNVGKLMSQLERMTVTELRRKYAEVFGEDALVPQGIPHAPHRLADSGAR
jgi:hypothetical protein